MNALLAALVLTLSATGDPYVKAMERADELEREGELGRAAAELERVLPQYPQDYALLMHAGRLRLGAGDADKAEGHYRRAIDLAPQSSEARLGLGWALLEQDRKADAREQFQRVLDAAPENAEARRGFKLSEPPATVVAYPEASFLAHAYEGQTNRHAAYGLSVGTRLLFVGRWLVGAWYRALAFNSTLPRGPGMPGQSRTSTSWEHEIQTLLGWSSREVGVGLHYAHIVDSDSGLSTPVHLVGASLRYSPWGDGWLEASVSLYDDLTVGRLALSWRLPVAGPFSVVPGGALQVTDDEVTGNGSLSLRLDWPEGGCSIGGTVGKEVRPAYLAMPTIYNFPEGLLYGVWAGGQVTLGTGWALKVAWELRWLRVPQSDPKETWMAHLFNLGITGTF